jgi:kynurenine 3-monooxygenase
MVLDLCIAEAGRSPAQLLEAAKVYSARWKPEVDAVSWMSVKSLFENRYHMLRATITARLGISIFGQAKSLEIPYSEVRRKAQRRWPLWV